MAILRRIRGREDGKGPAMATSLDIGTEYVKALVFRIEDGKGIVTGAGRTRQGLGHMQAATVTDIRGVVENCRSALREAEATAGIHPTQVIIGIAGELVKGFTTSHSQERRKPDAPITEQELDKLIEGVQREALLEAERSITWETGLPSVDVRLVHAAVTGSAIDGYPVTNPVGFKGRHVRISVFNAFAPLIHLGSLQTVAQRLDRELLAVVAEPYAVARCLNPDEVGAAGALFVDVGGGTTDVALVRQGGVEGTRMFALGGRAFTKSLADRLEHLVRRCGGGQDRVRHGPAGRGPRDHRGHHRRGRRGLVRGRGAGPGGVRQARPAAGTHRAVWWRLSAAPAGRRAARQGLRP